MVTTRALGHVRLSDGRRVDTWEGGDPTGSPVLYFHGTPAGRLQAALGDGAARRAGVRLIAFSRPGYGGSTDAPTTLSSVARDAVLVADARGVERFACLGVSGGGPYALATAALGPRVRAVGVVAGIGPLLVLDPSEVDPRAVDLARRGHPDAAAAVLDAAPAGHQVGSFVSPEILEPWTPGGRPGVPRYRGVSRDILAFSTGWDVDLGSVRAPVWLWYGDRDHLVHLEHGRWLRDHLATATLVVREGAGHLATFLPYWEEMLRTFTARGPLGSSP